MAKSAEEKRLNAIEKEEKTALKQSDKMYDSMINQSGTFYSDLQKTTEDYGKTQQEQLDKETAFTIEQIEQNKAKTEKDFQKEAGAAYTDWQKQTDPYGVNAEQMAQSGLGASGYSESSQVRMYAAYQQRVATARESYQNAVTSYNNAMTEAQLQNSSAKAEIAYNTLLASLQYALEGFQVGNDILIQKQTARRQIDDTYYGRYRDEVNQINTEKALAEEVRQYNASLKEEQRQFNENLAFQKKKSNMSSSGSGSGSYSYITETVANGDPADTVDNGGSKPKQTDSEGNLPLDMQSVTDLGYGMISAKELNKLVNSGEVISYEEGGKLKFVRAGVNIPAAIRNMTLK